MCKVEMLRVLVKQRLTAAVEEIFVVLERTIAEYEEELSRTKEENERQRQLLDALFNKHQQTDVSEDHLLPQQQEWSSRVGQEEPQPPHIKEEEHFEGPEEFPVIGVTVKSEEDEVKAESEETGEPERPSSSSSQHMTREGDGGGSQADLAPLSDSDETTSHSADTAVKLFVCSVCGKSFRNKKNLIRHARTHTGEKTYSCSFCRAIFSVRSGLVQHLRTHTGERPFPCAVCGESFSHRGHLKRHERTHSGEKPFPCSLCGLRFSRNTHLMTHTRTHTGEKPFSCSFCGKRFSLKGNLKSHERRHTGEKVFSCGVCDERFSYKYQVSNHKCPGKHLSGFI